MRIGFAGTPEFAEQILQQLIDADQLPIVVYTRRDKKTGRGRKLTPSPVKALAQQHQLPIEQPGSLRNIAAQQKLRDYKLDVLIVAAYGLILPLEALTAPKLGCLNVHASLLPRWRGAAPIERAIMAGDEETGVCLMQMDVGLDTGPVHCRQAVPITDQVTGAELSTTLAATGSRLLLDLLPVLTESKPEPQTDADATYADKITNADRPIDWARPASAIARQVRALTEREPATCNAGTDLKVQVLQAQATNLSQVSGETSPGTIVGAHKKAIEVATGDGQLQVTKVKLNRGKGSPLGPADLRNGYGEYFAPGHRLL